MLAGMIYRNFHNVARQFNNLPAEQYLGPMEQECEHCGALKFAKEKFHCCHNGKVSLDELSPYPDEFKNLLIGDTNLSKNFQSNIRKYNNVVTFASYGA